MFQPRVTLIILDFNLTNELKAGVLDATQCYATMDNSETRMQAVAALVWLHSVGSTDCNPTNPTTRRAYLALTNQILHQLNATRPRHKERRVNE